MGLDQYAYSVDAKLAKDHPIDIGVGNLTKKGQAHLVYEARKFYGLHSFMRDLYISRGGEVDELGLWGSVRVTPEDIDALEDLANSADLVSAAAYDYFLNTNEFAFEFINIAREEFAKGNVLYYYGF